MIFQMNEVPNGYRDLPLPASWQEALAALRPVDTPQELPRAPEVAPLADHLLAMLDRRERKLLELRWLRGLTLEATGEQLDGITRERVRQLESRIISRFQAEAAAFQRLERWLDGRDFCVAQLRSSRSTVNPEAEPEDLWTFVINAYAVTCGRPYTTARLSHGAYVLYLNDNQSVRLVELFQDAPAARWLPLAEVAAELGFRPADLWLGHQYDERILCTQGGLIGWVRWNNAQCLEAVAWHLADSGIGEWHFSEMAKALAAVWPDRFGSMTGRDVLGIVSRPNCERFQHAGRNGVWRLAARGDGHRTNRDAVIALLADADKPLPLEAIVKGLNRPVRQATIQALLLRDPAFRVEEGTFGLAR